MSLRLTWDGDMRFVAENENGVTVTMDTGTRWGGSGKYPTPMELLAISLAGCMGMDVASILKKMRVDLKLFEIVFPTRILLPWIPVNASIWPLPGRRACASWTWLPLLVRGHED